MKFDYGDTVYIKSKSNLANNELVVVSIIGPLEITTQRLAEIYSMRIGDMAYQIEYGDGSDEIIKEDDLEFYDFDENK